MLMKKEAIHKLPVFVTGVGRSGTHFLAEMFKNDKSIQAYHLDDLNTSIADSFYFYSEWFQLPIDHGNFLNHRREFINRANELGYCYFEANPYIAMSINELSKAFQGLFIFVTRNPVDVVNSHYVKGWYANQMMYHEAGKIIGYDYQAKRPNHYFGRIHPLEKEELERWFNLTRIGKIAWMWNAINLQILEQLNEGGHYLHVKIDKFDYAIYRDTCSFIGCNPVLKERQFNKIVASKPGKGKNRRFADNWTKEEKVEFIRESEPARSKLGYKYSSL